MRLSSFYFSLPVPALRLFGELLGLERKWSFAMNPRRRIELFVVVMVMRTSWRAEGVPSAMTPPLCQVCFTDDGSGVCAGVECRPLPSREAACRLLAGPSTDTMWGHGPHRRFRCTVDMMVESDCLWGTSAFREVLNRPVYQRWFLAPRKWLFTP